MAKHHDLDVGLQIVGRVGEELDETAQQEIPEGEETDRTSTRRRADPTNPLPKATISGLGALHAMVQIAVRRRIRILAPFRSFGLPRTRGRAQETSRRPRRGRHLAQPGIVDKPTPLRTTPRCDSPAAILR